MIKCVIWDIDNTLLAGTYLEAAGPPPAPDPGLLAVARELDGRGIVHALANKNPARGGRLRRPGDGPAVRGRGMRLGPEVGGHQPDPG